ncbi:hypothetical protein DRN34_03860, partial [Thermococci archaeon]
PGKNGLPWYGKGQPPAILNSPILGFVGVGVIVSVMTFVVVIGVPDTVFVITVVVVVVVGVGLLTHPAPKTKKPTRHIANKL